MELEPKQKHTESMSFRLPKEMKKKLLKLLKDNHFEKSDFIRQSIKESMSSFK